MVNEDIIKPVVDPTPWISPMVPVLKRDGIVRVCADFTELNKAVEKERFQFPVAEEVFAKMHGQSTLQPWTRLQGSGRFRWQMRVLT